MKEKIESLVRWIHDTAATAGGLLIPVSGGSDSALCFWLCSQAFPGKTVAVHAGTALRGKEWLESVGTVLYTEVPGDHAEREEMRWARFQSMSVARNAWLVGCRNRTEDLLGAYSLVSRVATLLPLIGTWKSDVLAMCAMVGVPKEVIASSLRADPDCGRAKELAEIAYDDIERFLKVRAREAPESDLAGLEPAQVAYLQDIYHRNFFKKNLPTRGPHV